jgi:hypothetical protein
MKKIMVILFILIASGLYGYDEDMDSMGVYFLGGFNWNPYLNDSGLNYIVDYYNQNQAGLTKKLETIRTYYGFTLGAGFLFNMGNDFGTIEFRYSGMFSPTVSAEKGGTNILELKEAHHTLGMDLAYLWAAGPFGFGPGAAIDMYTIVPSIKTMYANFTESTAVTVYGGRFFLQLIWFPFHSPLAVSIKPYYALYTSDSYYDLFNSVNNQAYNSISSDKLQTSVSHFGLMLEIYWYLTYDEKHGSY